MKRQLTELLTGYGSVGAVWFDGVWDQDQNPDFDWKLRGLYDHIHAIRPACLVGNNHHLVPFEGEDIQIFERDLPGENTAGLSGQEIGRLPLETCQTMNGMWGYKITDLDYKSSKTLIHYLVRAAGRNGNLLLNIDPQPDGKLPATAVERLREMGEWLARYGESIYGTRGGDIPPHDWGVTTRKGDKLYVHVLDLQDDALYFAACGKSRGSPVPEQRRAGEVRHAPGKRDRPESGACSRGYRPNHRTHFTMKKRHSYSPACLCSRACCRRAPRPATRVSCGAWRPISGTNRSCSPGRSVRDIRRTDDAAGTRCNDVSLCLYARGDITDYLGDFYLENVRCALSVRQEMPWGRSVSDELFRHFVLPVRVNNECLDDSRRVFHDELKPRVEGLSMYDAILEVNHWCHEKANYQPSDARTSSPLATVRTAYGRCGEESTLLVAALRSVGIPARQVYTPRWAHTDDNHAWVEAWADGRWHFLGACEPEPVLDLGWFNAPASRGMLMHTKVFGYYDGSEEVMKTTANYTEINVISNYAACAPLTVTVTDTAGSPVEGATVEFKLYNYAEFYTVSRKTTDVRGRASLSAGLGDMLVTAVCDGRFGVRKVSFGRETEATVVLEHAIGDEFSFPIDIVPPTESANLPEVTAAQRAENDRRFNREDSIRNAYIATFPAKPAVAEFARSVGMKPDDVAGFIAASRGNHAEIMDFLRGASRKGCTGRALQLLATLSEKDLRDTPSAVLADHLYNTDKNADAATVLAPRVADEMLTPYRSFLQREIPAADAAAFRRDPQRLVAWCRDSLTLCPELCTVSTTISPEGVWRSRTADKLSRAIFFVAAARSLGIPAWIDRVTGNLFYRHAGKDVPVDFDAAGNRELETGRLQLNYAPIPRLDDPEYFRHFSLSRFDGQSFSLLNYPDFERWSELFQAPADLETGYYMLVTGSRLASGSVLGNVSFFNVRPDSTTETNLTMRDNSEAVRVIGSFDSESKFTDAATGAETSVLTTAGRGYFVIGLLCVGQEPTDHALKDIAAKAAELEAWGRSLILLFPDEGAYRKYTASPAAPLPATVTFGIDRDGSVRRRILEAMQLPGNVSLPVFLIGDTFNRVVFESHGYTIGLGDRLLHTIHQL